MRVAKKENEKTHFASEVLLLAQDGLVPVELGFELRHQLLDALLVRRQPAVLLEDLFDEDAGQDRFELRILDARRLLEFRARLGVGRDQLGSRPERGDVTADSARLEQLKAIVLLLKKCQSFKQTKQRHDDGWGQGGRKKDERTVR